MGTSCTGCCDNMKGKEVFIGKATANNGKLYYFDLHGRAATIRMALWYVGAAYEDVRVSEKEFAKNKKAGKYQWGSMPVLTLNNGMTITQSNAIIRYVCTANRGKKGEQLSPGNSNPSQSYEIDLLLEDAADQLGKYFFMMGGDATEAQVDAVIREAWNPWMR